MKHLFIAVGFFFVFNHALWAEEGIDSPKSYQTDTLPDGTVVYLNPDTFASFPGGNKAMIEFINRNLKYPIHAMESSFQGTVVIKMVIRENGRISNIVVVRSVHEMLDKEAILAVSLMPDFIPAKVKGENVASCFTMPVRFTLY
ncbi:MAG: energy transducer TonB [Prevotellaceae bacterium]|nr:energy transducer TonB [Prevotellaceae bacterium]